MALFVPSISSAFTNTSKLAGRIGKYKIHMTLTINYDTGVVSGTYYYDSQWAKGNRQKMSVYGHLSSINDGRIHMEEYAPSGANTGCFDGSFNIGDNGVCIYGNFRNYARGQNYSLILLEY